MEPKASETADLDGLTDALQEIERAIQEGLRRVRSKRRELEGGTTDA